MIEGGAPAWTRLSHVRELKNVIHHARYGRHVSPRDYSDRSALEEFESGRARQDTNRRTYQPRPRIGTRRLPAQPMGAEAIGGENTARLPHVQSAYAEGNHSILRRLGARPRSFCDGSAGHSHAD
jgi:hypothetical protein